MSKEGEGDGQPRKNNGIPFGNFTFTLRPPQIQVQIQIQTQTLRIQQHYQHNTKKTYMDSFSAQNLAQCLIDLLLECNVVVDT